MLYNNSGTWAAFNGIFWDDSLSRIGIGTTSPTQKIEVNGAGLIGGVLLSASNIGLASDINLIELENNAVTINGTLETTGAITAPTTTNTINGLVINNGNITTGSWSGSVVTVSYGGTGTNTLNNHALLVGSGTDPVRTLGLGTDGQILIGQTGGDPTFATLSGDIASITTSGSVAFANTGVVAGSYGSSTIIPQITVDSKGPVCQRLTYQNMFCRPVAKAKCYTTTTEIGQHLKICIGMI